MYKYAKEKFEIDCAAGIWYDGAEGKVKNRMETQTNWFKLVANRITSN